MNGLRGLRISDFRFGAWRFGLRIYALRESTVEAVRTAAEMVPGASVSIRG